jgi:hypothetical protein
MQVMYDDDGYQSELYLSLAWIHVGEEPPAPGAQPNTDPAAAVTLAAWKLGRAAEAGVALLQRKQSGRWQQHH